MPAAPELVSVIIPTRNRPELLKPEVASVVAQDYRPIQLVVVDNASDVPVLVDSGDLDCVVHRNVSMRNWHALCGRFAHEIDINILACCGSITRRCSCWRFDPTPY